LLAPRRAAPAKSVPSGFNRISTVAGFRSAVGQELEIVQFHVAVERFLATLKAVYAGKAEEVEDEARGSAMRAAYPCPWVRSCPFRGQHGWLPTWLKLFGSKRLMSGINNLF
jgi:hypothetical protein